MQQIKKGAPEIPRDDAGEIRAIEVKLLRKRAQRQAWIFVVDVFQNQQAQAGIALLVGRGQDILPRQVQPVNDKGVSGL